eukprot:s2032_g10.t1
MVLQGNGARGQTSPPYEDDTGAAAPALTLGLACRSCSAVPGCGYLLHQDVRTRLSGILRNFTARQRKAAQNQLSIRDGRNGSEA